MGFPPWGSPRAFGTACGTRPCMTAHVHTQTHQQEHQVPKQQPSVFPDREPGEHQHGPGLGGGRAMSSSALKQGQEKGLITAMQPHTSPPLQPISWAAPALPGQPHRHSAFCHLLVPGRRRSGSRSPSSVTGEGNGGCFGVWGLGEVRPNQELWISQGKKRKK